MYSRIQFPYRYLVLFPRNGSFNGVLSHPNYYRTCYSDNVQPITLNRDEDSLVIVLRVYCFECLIIQGIIISDM